MNLLIVPFAKGKLKLGEDNCGQPCVNCSLTSKVPAFSCNAMFPSRLNFLGPQIPYGRNRNKLWGLNGCCAQIQGASHGVYKAIYASLGLKHSRLGLYPQPHSMAWSK